MSNLDETAKAAIALYALLPSLETLCELDSKSSNAIASSSHSVTFRVPHIGSQTFNFKNGKCHTGTADPDNYRIGLQSISPTHFNKVISGASQPIPYQGIRHISFMQKEFQTLTQRLEALLTPSDPAALTPEEQEIAVKLQLRILAFSLSQVATYDPKGKNIATATPDGILSLKVAPDTTYSLHISHHSYTTCIGEKQPIRAWMKFDSLDSFGSVLTGTEDTFSLLGRGAFSMEGYLPIIDNVNRLLSRTGQYLDA
jgi:hypothetical protein